MILITTQMDELFCETDEEVKSILESAENDSREIVCKEIKKLVKKFKDCNGDRQVLEYFRVRITYRTTTINDIVEEYYM